MMKEHYKKIPKLFVDKISVTYNNGYIAIYDISFHLKGGNICAVIGINGSGKSTLFKSIMGLISPTCGKIYLNNYPIQHSFKYNIISYIPQIENIDWNFPILVEDVVMMGRYGKMNFLRIPNNIDYNIINNALYMVDLLSVRKRQINELSGGQKKRVFLARALAQQGKVLILDEPFTGIDIKTEQSIINLLIDLKNKGYMILIATHNLYNIPEFCNKVMFINRTILSFGSVKNHFNKKNLQNTFGNVLKEIYFFKKNFK